MAIELPDGEVVRNIPEQVAYLTEQFEIIMNLVETALSGVMLYKGSVATYSDLPSEGVEIGWFYNVIDTGANYCWDGTQWDEVGSPIDLSNLVDLDSEQIIAGKKHFLQGIYFDAGNNVLIFKDPDDGSLRITSAARGIKFGGSIFPSSDNLRDIGRGSLRFRRLYLAGQININTSGKGLLFPDTSGFTADKTLATLDDVGTKLYQHDLVIDTPNYDYMQISVITASATPITLSTVDDEMTFGALRYVMFTAGQSGTPIYGVILGVDHSNVPNELVIMKSDNSILRLSISELSGADTITDTVTAI